VDPLAKVIIASSGLSDIGPMEETLGAAAKRFVDKPHEMKEIVRLVRIDAYGVFSLYYPRLRRPSGLNQCITPPKEDVQ